MFYVTFYSVKLPERQKPRITYPATISCNYTSVGNINHIYLLVYSFWQCPDYFVVGYGMDFAEQYRNLPFVGVLKPELYK